MSGEYEKPKLLVLFSLTITQLYVRSSPAILLPPPPLVIIYKIRLSFLQTLSAEKDSPGMTDPPSLVFAKLKHLQQTSPWGVQETHF
jgi:hypothetical protein